MIDFNCEGKCLLTNEEVTNRCKYNCINCTEYILYKETKKERMEKSNNEKSNK